MPNTALKSSKSAALEICSPQHRDLIHCFKVCKSYFKPCCQEENQAFWDCYKKERGIDESKGANEIGRAVFGFLDSLKPSRDWSSSPTDMDDPPTP